MMKLIALLSVFILLLVVTPAFLFTTTPAYAATNPSLGTAASYSILAGSAVTNTGATTVSGDVGITPGTVPPNYTGFGTVTLGGTIHDADGAALTAMGDKNTAYTALASQGCDTDYGAVTKELAGETLVPGVYCANSFHLSSGTLTLNGGASDVWIFKSASDLIISGGSAAKVDFTGGGQPCNVWWRVVSTATFDANSTLVGNILADTSITFAAGASLDGRALARTAEVTMSSNSITGPTCAAPTPTPTPTPTTSPSSDSSSSTSSSESSSGGGTTVCPALDSSVATPTILESRRVDSNSIFISWGPYSGIDTFNIQYGPADGNWLYNVDVNGFSTTLDSLPPNQSIWVRVAARSSCTIGAYGASKLIGGQAAAVNPNVLGASIGFPNTGIGPKNDYAPKKDVLWNIIALDSMFIVLFFSFARRTQRFAGGH